jgi:3-hydroxyisobutyrate dehydrogenase-like beta-hydroxyacid dehydrogenase
MTTLAVLGAGTMGAPIARNLLRARYPVRVWNRTPAKAEAARHGGLTLPLTAALLRRWQDAIALGHGDDDVASAVTAFAETPTPTAKP